ncbi:MAG: hypothetical protein JOZ70_01290 [Pseudolabrys sp.]|nr:hypothetical protein [Pseudolabrys sp.]
MKKIAVIGIAFAVLAGTQAFARDSRHHQQSWNQQQSDSGYYDPAKVRSGDVPFGL